ncbi:MAG TPA: hypothetical protein VFF28_00305 [Candidatus Nanoarchaeia archaeon]|nr:hypothetical protein [Candidatus Nanoarchaeia archaeon]
MDEILSEHSLLGFGRATHQSNIGDAEKLREIVRHIFSNILPAMYEFGAYRSQFDEGEQKTAVHRVFDRLALSYGEAPSDGIPIPQIVSRIRENTALPNTQCITSELQYSDPWKSTLAGSFPPAQGNSLLAQIFRGMPYFGHSGKIYRLSPISFFAWNRPKISSDDREFCLEESADFSTLNGQYAKMLELQLRHQLLDQLKTDSQILNGIRNPEWYIERAIQSGYFEWDFVGFFVYRESRYPSCCVFRRISKFAVVDPLDNNPDPDERRCFFFGETRVGMKVSYTYQIDTGERPFVIDKIDHPADMGDYICNAGSYPGDVANQISEGIATLRHSITPENSYKFLNKGRQLTVRQARNRGFEVYQRR